MAGAHLILPLDFGGNGPRVAVKDVIDIADTPTRAGSRACRPSGRANARPSRAAPARCRALSGWQRLPGHGNLSAMAHAPNPYRGFRYPAEVIQHAAWLYHCLSLSLRDVEAILAARGIVVS